MAKRNWLRFRMVFSHPYSLIVLFWSLCYIWRPLYFGFYSDDYTVLFEPLKFHPASEWLDYYTNLYSNRILAGVFSYVLLGAFKVNPFLWQLYGATVVLAESLLFFKALQTLNALQTARLDRKIIALIACLWIINPFSFGFTAWPAHMVTGLCVVAFLLAFIAYFQERFLASFIFYSISCLTLEAYYFQFILFLGLSWIYQHRFSLKRTRLVHHLVVFSLLQLSFILYNRLIQNGTRKSFNPDFILTRVLGVLRNPMYWIEALIPLLIGAFFVALLIRNVRKMRNRSIEPHHAALLLLGFCALVNLLMYMSVGYSIRPFGIASKTTIAISALFIFIVFVLAQRFPRRARLALVIVILFFAPIFIRQTKDWADSWSLQQKVIHAFPAEVIAREGREKTLLAIVPNRVNSVLVFEESWALGPALRAHYSVLNEVKVEYITHKFGTFSATRTVYDGGQVTQVGRLSGHVYSGLENQNELLLWNYFDGTLRRVDHPFVLEEDLSSDYLSSISTVLIE